MTKPIKKIVYTVFAFENDVEAVTDALHEAFGEVDADCYGGTAEVLEPSDDEEAEARPEMEGMDSFGAPDGSD